MGSVAVRSREREPRRFLVDELEIGLEHLPKSLGDGLEQDNLIDDREVSPGGHGVLVGAMMGGRRQKRAQILLSQVGLLVLGQREIVVGQAVSEAAAARVDLDEERLGLFATLQLDEVVAAAERAELIEPALRPPGPAKGDLPIVVDGDALTLGAIAGDARAVLGGVVLGASPDDVLQLGAGEPTVEQRSAARTERDAFEHFLVKGELPIGCRALPGDVALGADHAATNVEADRAHREGAAVAVGQDDAADRHAVAEVGVGGDADQACAREARRVDDLPVDRRLGLAEQVFAEKEPDGHAASVTGLEGELALAGSFCEQLPLALVQKLVARAHHVGG